LASSRDNALNFLLRKDIGSGALAPSTEDIVGWEFMASVFRVHKADKAYQRHQPIMPLGFGRALSRPGNRGLGHHMGIPACHGKAGKVTQIVFGALQLKAGGASHVQISVDSSF
jgi:hypothetical protein